MTLRFVFRSGCCLCDAMWAELIAHYPDASGAIEALDLSGIPDLEERYGTRVPVLEADGKELCRYFLDTDSVDRYLDRTRNAV
ncbi:MAG: glutaredoxin family protein [Pseudomonadota bacterium]